MFHNTVDDSEIWKKTIDVVNISLLFTHNGFKNIQTVVGNGISESSTGPRGSEVSTFIIDMYE